MGLIDQYSGIVINQNATASGGYPWRANGGGWIYQTFTLPSNYERGTNPDELRIPDLSGFQVFVNIDTGYALTAALDYTVQSYTNNAWTTAVNGTVIGSVADGQTWFDIILDQSLPVPEDNLTIPYRLGLATRTTAGQPIKMAARVNGNNGYTVGGNTFTAYLINGIPYPITLNGSPAFLLLQNGTVTASYQEGIATISYVTPSPMPTTPLGVAQAYQADGVTPLLGTNLPTASLNFRVLGLTADNGINFLGDEYRSVVVFTSPGNTDTTRGQAPISGSGSLVISPSKTLGPSQLTGRYYLSAPQPSKFAITNLYWDVRSSNAGPSVLDGVLVDPLTPNMKFNVYYSKDDTRTRSSMTEDDWDQKLWTRIPQVYTCTQRQEYIFPQPVIAKYMKLEFTNGQAQGYKPGRFAKPLQYKKFPTWVAAYFLAQMIVPAFVAGQVIVEQDALSFAYSYYLDDLQQQRSPRVSTQNALGQLSQYFSPTNATAGVDSTTLNKINLSMNIYQSQTANINTQTTLGGFVQSLFSASGTSLPIISEAQGKRPIDYSIVSSLNRDSVKIEQSWPNMYFFIPCRHTYKEVTASLEYHRAYFMGVKQVAFLRHNYTVPADTSVYVESGGDNSNMDYTDWQLDAAQNWYAY